MERELSMKINGNQSAFPSVSNCDYYAPTGLTIRQWYAGLALQGLLASLSTEFACGQLGDEMQYQGIADSRRPEWVIVKAAYGYADAMLDEPKAD